MLEYRVSAGAPADGAPIKELGLPPRVLVAVCCREQSVFIPYGDNVLRGGDTVLIACARRSSVVFRRLMSQLPSA